MEILVTQAAKDKIESMNPGERKPKIYMTGYS